MRMSSQFGIDVFLGQAEFVAKNQVAVNGQVLTFSKACIASGARPTVPQYDGIDSVPYYTSDNIFNLT